MPGATCHSANASPSWPSVTADLTAGCETYSTGLTQEHTQARAAAVGLGLSSVHRQEGGQCSRQPWGRTHPVPAVHASGLAVQRHPHAAPLRCPEEGTLSLSARCQIRTLWRRLHTALPVPSSILLSQVCFSQAWRLSTGPSSPSMTINIPRSFYKKFSLHFFLCLTNLTGLLL